MSHVIGNKFPDYLLVDAALKNKEMDKSVLEAVKRLKGLADYQPKIKMLCNAVDLRLTTIAVHCSLYFRETKQLAVISGAGIAGLAASFELRARGFKVVIAEKREDFSRFNVINLNVETQFFLKKFNLLKKFERCVAPRITEHRYIIIKKTKTAQRFTVSDVWGLKLDESVSFESNNFTNLFDRDGVYSVPIGILQTFLAENALKFGVHIYANGKVKVLARTRAGGVSKVHIAGGRILRPSLFFIAEGAHSTTALQLGIETKEVTNACTGENWVFGNMTYPGKETFVVSLIDTSEKNLRLANMIFNAKSQVINVAVTSDKGAREERIREQILRAARQVFDQKAFPIEKMKSTLLSTVRKRVHIVNRISSPFSMGNVFCIGDAAGSSSPLAGLGGTLGLTLVPLTVRQLLNDYERQSEDMNKNFDTFSKAYTGRWIEKSKKVKKLCLSLFEKRS